MDLTHHLSTTDQLPYREGVTLPPRREVSGTLIDIGIGTAHLPDQSIPPHTRVTLDISNLKATEPYLTNMTLAESTDPTRKLGYHWGYTTRLASSLSTVITESPYPNGYDFVIATSERGEELSPKKCESLPPFQHLLVVLGGQAGIEAAAENDAELKLGSGDVKELFDWWVNCAVGQGSRTIRTEEAIWIIMAQMFAEFKRKGVK
jgi:methyltransferase